MSTTANKGWELIHKSFDVNRQGYKDKLRYAAIHIANSKTLDKLAYKLGTGECTIRDIKILMDKYKEIDEDVPKIKYIEQRQQPLKGIEDTKWVMAKCCMPLPGEPLIGLLGDEGKLVRIHRNDCERINHIDRKKIHISWNCNYCLLTIQIRMKDGKDILRPFLDDLAKFSIFMNLRDLTTHPNQTFSAHFAVEIRDRKEFDILQQKIQENPNVQQQKLKSLIPGGIA